MLKINDENAFEVLCSIEGDDWKKYELTNKSNPGEYSFFGILARYREMYYEMKRADIDPDTEIGATGMVLYGGGGVSRYGILNSGEICLWGSSCSPKRRRKAKEAGIRVWGE